MQHNTKGTALPVVTQPAETVFPLSYNGSELQKTISDFLNDAALFTMLNSDFIPDYTKDGEKGKRYLAVFTQVYTVKQVEDNGKGLRPVLRQVTREKIAAIPKDGSLTGMELNGKDKDGKDLYSPVIEQEVKGWQSVKLEPIVNLIPTRRNIAVVFMAGENLTVKQFTVLAVNTLALVCENYEINGKPAPIRKTAGINLSFNHAGKAVNTGKLGEGLRAGLLSSDLNRFTDLMLRKIALIDKQTGKAEIKPGLVSKLAAK